LVAAAAIEFDPDTLAPLIQFLGAVRECIQGKFIHHGFSMADL
jgi:hypothetical protein